MKTLCYIRILCVLLVVASFNSCVDNSDELTSGIASQSWQENQALEIVLGHELSVSFNASGDWTASSDAAWCMVRNDKGLSGQSTLNLLAATTTDTPRSATITIHVAGYQTASFKVTQQATSHASTENMELNAEMDSYLRRMYLWNDEYKTLKLDFTKNYEAFLQDALLSMKTNTLDKRKNANGKYGIFSFIKKNPSMSSSRTTKIVRKALRYSFGITGITPASFNDGSYYLCIQGIHPDSPAEAAGLQRGTIITQVNGEKLTYNLAGKYFASLQIPNSPLALQLTDSNKKQIRISSKAMYVNPVIFKQVKEVNGHKVGYLVYSEFDASFDEELFDAFKYFKSQHVTDLILDLRYNGGGHTMSANLMASCIAGSSVIGKVFTSLRYNDDRMKAMNNKRADDFFSYSNYRNLATSLADGDLGLSHVYCLVGQHTASSSELVINSLRGIDVKVTLVGETTTGKNVGMEYTDILLGQDVYTFYPITFQSYNAKGFGDYEKGFTPDRVIDETDPNGDTPYFTPPVAYGADNEPLYAAAVEMITGVALPKSRSLTNLPIKGQVQKMEVPARPGSDGMIKLPTE